MNPFRLVILVALATASLGSPPAAADFESKRMAEEVYYVAFERSERLSHGMFDTDKQVRKKLRSKTAKLCRKEGFGFVRYVTMNEVRRDDDLRRAWREATGEEPSAATSTRSASSKSTLSRSHHRYRCLALFSKTKRAGYEKCR